MDSRVGREERKINCRCTWIGLTHVKEVAPQSASRLSVVTAARTIYIASSS